MRTHIHPPRSARGRRGFTLIELVITLVIMAVAAAIAIPRFAQQSSRYRADLASARLARELELLHEQARATSTTAMANFNLQTEVMLTFHGAATGIWTPISFADAPYEADLLGAQFDGAPSLSFNGFGLPNAEGTVTLAAGDETRVVKVSGQDGSITVQ